MQGVPISVNVNRNEPSGDGNIRVMVPQCQLFVANVVKEKRTQDSCEHIGNQLTLFLTPHGPRLCA